MSRARALVHHPHPDRAHFMFLTNHHISLIGQKFCWAFQIGPNYAASRERRIRRLEWPIFFCILAYLLKKYLPLHNLITFLDPLLSAILRGVEVTRLGAIDISVEVCNPLATRG